MWDKVITLYEGYIGTGMIAGLYLVAMIYLFVTEKNKNNRILFLYMPAIILFLYFNPLFATIVYAVIGEEPYYRLLWMVPIVPVLSYAAVKIIMACNGKKRAAVGLALGAIVILSGRLVYASPYFSKAENVYHVPDTVVELCDRIEVEDIPVMAAFPTEFIQYVRQYNARICMPYGREILVDRWNVEDRLYELLQADTLEVGEIAENAGARGCHYLIFSKEKKLHGSFEQYGYELFGEVDGYLIYKDMELCWWE